MRARQGGMLSVRCLVWTLKMGVVLGALGLTVASPATAEAQDGAIGLRVGALRLDDAGRDEWRPTLRLDGAVSVVGPLQLGGYVQATAEALPLQDPGFGTGGLIRLAPHLPFGITPYVELTAGWHQLPSRQGVERSVVAAVAGGLAIGIGNDVAIDLRAEYLMLHALGDGSSLGRDALAASGGFRFLIR